MLLLLNAAPQNLRAAPLAPSELHAPDEAVASPLGHKVDVSLVVVVVSPPQDKSAHLSQRAQIAEAFKAPGLLRAIDRGQLRQIAAKYIELSGNAQPFTVSGWRLIDGMMGATAFAATIESAPIKTSDMGTPSVAAGIEAGLTALGGAGIDSARQIIEVMTPIPGGSGGQARAPREAALAAGITINLLVLDSACGKTGVHPSPGNACLPPSLAGVKAGDGGSTQMVPSNARVGNSLASQLSKTLSLLH